VGFEMGEGSFHGPSLVGYAVEARKGDRRNRAN
jgi:hypothetical protein